MPIVRIIPDHKDQIHFLTHTIQNWYPLFKWNNRWDILFESLRYFQTTKWLKIYAYVFMYNHIHLIMQSRDLIQTVRDFKKYTSHLLMDDIINNEPWITNLFVGSNWKFSIWKESNMPKLVESEQYYFQKRNYIEQNPMKKWYVNNPQDWKYSSANMGSPIIIDNPT